MSLFSKILEEKLKKQQLDIDVCNSSTTTHSNFSAHETISVDLLRWLNSSPFGRKTYYKIDESSYSVHKKDPRLIEKMRFQREKQTLESVLERLHSEKEKQSVLFFYTHGARSFMSFRGEDLKKDYRKLAFKFHPDRHTHDPSSVKSQFEENFRVLSESYETLQLLFSRAKNA